MSGFEWMDLARIPSLGEKVQNSGKFTTNLDQINFYLRDLSASMIKYSFKQVIQICKENGRWLVEPHDDITLDLRRLSFK